MKEEAKLWNINYLTLLVLSIFTATSFSMVTPVLTKYAANIGLGLSVAGSLSGVLSITALIARPFSGLLSDRVNKKLLMVVSTTVTGFSIVMYGMTASAPALFVLRILHGAAFAFSGTCNIAMASRYIPKERMGEGIGYLGIGNIIAQAIGPNLGLALMDISSYRTAFLVGGILAFGSALVMFLLVRYEPERRVIHEKISLHFSDLIAPKLIPYAIFGGLFSLCNGIVSSFLAMLGDERGIVNVGIFFILNAATLLLVRIFGGKLMDKYGLTPILIPSYLFASTAMFLVSGAKSVAIIGIAGILKALGQGMAQPAIQTACIKSLPDVQRGVAVSTFYVGADVGQGLGGALGGTIAQSFGYTAMYCGAGCLMLAALAMYVCFEEVRKKKVE
jgi:predicted MFS family arabinose efflux permease